MVCLGYFVLLFSVFLICSSWLYFVMWFECDGVLVLICL